MEIATLLFALAKRTWHDKEVTMENDVIYISSSCSEKAIHYEIFPTATWFEMKNQVEKAFKTLEKDHDMSCCVCYTNTNKGILCFHCGYMLCNKCYIRSNSVPLFEKMDNDEKYELKFELEKLFSEKTPNIHDFNAIFGIQQKIHGMVPLQCPMCRLCMRN